MEKTLENKVKKVLIGGAIALAGVTGLGYAAKHVYEKATLKGAGFVITLDASPNYMGNNFFSKLIR